MNKRAKKRVKEAIEKKNLEREEGRKELHRSSPKAPAQQRGFVGKPAKKRG
jgi:hypothetical protein